MALQEIQIVVFEHYYLGFEPNSAKITLLLYPIGHLIHLMKLQETHIDRFPAFANYFEQNSSTASFRIDHELTFARKENPQKILLYVKEQCTYQEDRQWKDHFEKRVKVSGLFCVKTLDLTALRKSGSL